MQCEKVAATFGEHFIFIRNKKKNFSLGKERNHLFEVAKIGCIEFCFVFDRASYTTPCGILYAFSAIHIKWFKT
jgi:hypothetical protein